jgi:hypothetical protein
LRLLAEAFLSALVFGDGPELFDRFLGFLRGGVIQLTRLIDPIE